MILFTLVECSTYGCRNYGIKTAHEFIESRYIAPRFVADYDTDIYLGRYYCDESYINYDIWWDPHNDIIKLRYGSRETDQSWLSVSNIRKDFKFDDEFKAFYEGAERAIKHFRGERIEPAAD